jgi:ketosteroid isomerase-like protein
MMRRTLLLSLLPVAILGMVMEQGASQNKTDAAEQTKREVLRVEDQRNHAMLKADTTALDRIYADEIAWTMSTGELLTKAQILANIRSGKQKLDSIIVSDDIRLHVYGNTVVMTGRTPTTLRYKGSSIDYPRRYTNVYVKQAGQWQLVVHHSTPVAQQ